MKAIATLFCILSLVTISKCSHASEEKERIRAMYFKCKNETTDDSEIEFETKKMMLATTHTAKCIMSCMLRESGVIINGKFNREGTLKLVGDAYYANNKEHVEKIKSVFDICEKQVANETEECNLGIKVGACLLNESLKVGLF